MRRESEDLERQENNVLNQALPKRNKITRTEVPKMRLIARFVVVALRVAWLP